MSDTKSLLRRIAAFRERLEQLPALTQADGTATHGLAVSPPAAIPATWLSQTLRSLSAAPAGPTATPSKLLGRARRLVEQARELVAAQREVSDDPYYVRIAEGSDPLVTYHAATVSATEAALRLLQVMPESAEFQSRVCDGLETVLGSVRDRLSLTTASLDRRRKEFGRVERVARLLCDIQARRLVSFASFVGVAEELIDEARAGLPLRFPVVPVLPVPRFVAAHAVTVAALMARLAPHDFEWANQPVIPVALAMMMDVGMLAVPSATLCKPTEWTDEDRRSVERHPQVGADLLREVMPELGPLAEVVAAHHERPDGTGYPNGKTGDAIPTLAAFLQVADEYAGRLTDRPHRPAHDPRAALTDLLLAAEEGKANNDFVEYLLKLSFYPVGTVVELTDGRVGVVVSTHPNKVGLRATARPVVSVMTDTRGVVLPQPQVVDLAGSEFGGVVRAISTAEKVKLFAATHPDLCG
jgi:hypothetical protein